MVFLLDRHQPVRFRERQRLQQHRIHQTEDRGCRPNPQRQSHDRRNRKRRTLPQLAETETEIAKETLHAGLVKRNSRGRNARPGPIADAAMRLKSMRHPNGEDSICSLMELACPQADIYLGLTPGVSRCSCRRKARGLMPNSARKLRLKFDTSPRGLDLSGRLESKAEWTRPFRCEKAALPQEAV